MTHTVKKGDTLSAIADKFNTTVEALVASNGIKNKNLIKVGQVLRIPENNDTLLDALNACLSAIEGLEEYKRFIAMLEV